MNWLALDIGGANLKVSDGQAFSLSYPFALWRAPNSLPQFIRNAIAESPGCDHLAVTMTGELADCFENKEQGVRFILDAVAQGGDNRHTRVYLSDGRLVSPQAARGLTRLAAASNWHALAAFAGRFAQNDAALLVDCGSTTTDIIPLAGGKPVAAGRTDTERLASGELVYTGVERSPICALAFQAPYRGAPCPLVQELFANSRDIYLLTGDLPEAPTDTSTADGRPATRAAARARLGRMLAADGEEFNHRDAVTLAQFLAAAQAQRVAAAIKQVLQRMPLVPKSVIFSGHGDFLVKAALEIAGLAPATTISLAREIGPQAARCGPAYALAVLAREARGAVA